MSELLRWIVAQRAACAVQKQRWEGVAPERLEEACDKLESLYKMVVEKEQAIAVLQTELGEALRLIDTLRSRVPEAGQVPAGTGYTPDGQNAAPGGFSMLLLGSRAQSWHNGAVPATLEVLIPAPSPAVGVSIHHFLVTWVGAMVNLRRRQP